MDDLVGDFGVSHLFDHLLALSERQHSTKVSAPESDTSIDTESHVVLTRLCYRSFAFYFTILTTWALQVQFLLQIIINRCSILLPDKRAARRLKFYVALLITAINISVYCIWVPARLQISERYIHINEFWDRTEKVIYLLVDAALNLYFIIIVKRVSECSFTFSFGLSLTAIIESRGKWPEEVQETHKLQHLHHRLLIVYGHPNYQHDESQKHLRVNTPRSSRTLDIERRRCPHRRR